MRRVCLLLLLPLAGCHPPLTPLVAVAAIDTAFIPVFHRDAVDLVYSLATRRNCSIVRLSEGLRYCKPPEPEPPGQQFCTRTLGMAECFATPETLADHPSPLGDAPALNAAQEQDRTARWPNW